MDWDSWQWKALSYYVGLLFLVLAVYNFSMALIMDTFLSLILAITAAAFGGLLVTQNIEELRKKQMGIVENGNFACINCRRLVRDNARRCPYCHEPFEEDDHVMGKEGTLIGKSKLMVIGIMVIVIGGLVFAFSNQFVHYDFTEEEYNSIVSGDRISEESRIGIGETYRVYYSDVSYDFIEQLELEEKPFSEGDDILVTYMGDLGFDISMGGDVTSTNRFGIKSEPYLKALPVEAVKVGEGQRTVGLGLMAIGLVIGVIGAFVAFRDEKNDLELKTMALGERSGPVRTAPRPYHPRIRKRG